MKLYALITFLILILLSGSLSAASPLVEHQGDIRYVSGGVGDDERRALQAMAGQFDLKLVFAAKDGAFVADVAVAIVDSQGRPILTAISQGPWFYVQLPAGHYQIRAAYAGRTQQRAMTVSGDRLAQAVMTW